ncbi:DNA uptake porin HofQ [Enterobacteriaceae bacterium LUAb1]
MKRILYILMLCSMVVAAQSRITLVFDQAPVDKVLQALARHQGINVVLAPDIHGKLSLNLQQVPWSQALDVITRMSGLVTKKDGNVLMVWPASWQEKEDLRQKSLREAAQARLPLENQRMVLRWADAAVVNASLQAERDKLLTPRGSITLDGRTNTLLLQDTHAALKRVEQWVRELDMPVAQVELAAHIVSISADHLRELGVSWGMLAGEMSAQAPGVSQATVNLATKNAAGTIGMNVARIDSRLLEVQLSALERQNQLDIIASPRLFTSHQQPASIKQGTEIPYEVSSGNNGTTSIEFKEAVLGMNVTPVVQSEGYILLKLHISQNIPGRSIRNEDRELLTIDKQEIDTQVVVRNGQTLALGGIFQRQKMQGQEQVPGLGRIPWLGRLFHHNIKEGKKRELVIFITPRLINDQRDELILNNRLLSRN